MTLEELKDKLREINQAYSGDEEVAHIKADEALLEYIGDKEVKTLFDELAKWYA